jgi:hypothetical protein
LVVTEMENVGRYIGIFFGHLVFYSAIWYIFLPFGTFYGYLADFPLMWLRKNLATLVCFSLNVSEFYVSWKGLAQMYVGTCNVNRNAHIMKILRKMFLLCMYVGTDF